MLKCYDNRELSWLKFNERVLEEAMDNSLPLCERLMFSSIFQSNLDEFFMIRVGSLLDQLLVAPDFCENKTNLDCKEQLDAILSRAAELVPRRDNAYKRIIESFNTLGFEQVNFNVLFKNENKYLAEYFDSEIKPLISPQIIDKRHPFPFFRNKDIYAVAQLESKSSDSVKLGVIPASGNFDRLIFLPLMPDGKMRFMLIEDLILHYMPKVFERYHIVSKTLMRVTRNADINADEALFYDQDMDFREVMSELIKKRKKLSPVRMELSRDLNSTATQFLCEKFEIRKNQVFKLHSPLDLSFVIPFESKLSNHPEFFFEKLTPQNSPDVNPNESVIAQIERRDILLSYPYESMRPFIRMLNEVAYDQNVVSVKITLYRVAKNSKVIDALINMAESGKDVLVLVELRARFDEENNIGWSKRLENAGCTVIYGLDDIKVHSKLLLITRKLGKEIKYITQIGTGNYNEKTSTMYTDLSLMTANQNIGLEAAEVFNALVMSTCIESTNTLLVAPLCLQNKVLNMIDEEIRLAKNNQKAYIGLKLNSLTDKVIISKLIEASIAGVKVELIIRGICCLIAGVPEVTENITVTSIVGRFLEHSRIYIFGTASNRKVYISSADFMTRNTLRRVEVAVPILDNKIRERILDMFCIMLQDNVKARVQDSKGNYVKKNVDDSTGAVAKPLNSQTFFYKQAYDRTVPISANNTSTITSSLTTSPKKTKKHDIMAKMKKLFGK